MSWKPEVRSPQPHVIGDDIVAVDDQGLSGLTNGCAIGPVPLL